MVTNSDGSIGPALPVNNIRIGVNGAITYAPSNNATVDITPILTATTTTNTVSSALNNSAASLSLVAGGIMVVSAGIWVNDAAAAAGGVPIGGLYKRTDGIIAFRQV